MRLGKDARQSRLGEPEANTEGVTRGRSEGSIVVTASMPETIESLIEAH